MLVSNEEVDRMVGIQVKTPNYAKRTRGRGKNKKDHHFEFPLGYKSAKINSRNLIFAFVDLNDANNHDIQPNIYFVPSFMVYEHCKDWVEQSKMVRFLMEIEKLKPFENNFDFIRTHRTYVQDHLTGGDDISFNSF